MRTAYPPATTKLPLSGDVSQVINPWSWFQNSMGQFGYININQTVSSNRSMEREIVEKVAGYGKQLGRVSEALAVLIAKMPLSKLDEKEKKAFKDFQDMEHAIGVVKAGYGAPTRENIDHLIAGIRFLKEQDKDAYKEITDKLRKELLGKEAP